MRYPPFKQLLRPLLSCKFLFPGRVDGVHKKLHGVIANCGEGGESDDQTENLAPGYHPV